MPLLIEDAEWQAIAAGLVQRAELFERVVADIYGDNRLVADGLLPPRLIAASPEYLRPMVGVRPAEAATSCISAPSSSAAGRTAAGGCSATARRRPPAPVSRWRTASPPRARCPIIYGEMNVHRLAGFFRDFRDALYRHGRRLPAAASPS